MADLSKIDARIQIENRLAEVSSALKNLDKLNAKAESLELELSKLKAQEAAILSDNTREDELKLPDLLAVRGLCDLKAAAIAVLRDAPSTGNFCGPIPGKITQAEEQVHCAGDDAARFLAAYHAAVVVRLKKAIQEATSAFIQEEDAHDLFQIAARHPTVRTILWMQLPSFVKQAIAGYSHDIREARLLQAVWSDLQSSADAIGGELAVSIPDPWLEALD